jgi:threonine/homoserine/homoserine lactone efflux protein
VRDAADVPRRDPPYCHTEKLVSPPGWARDDLRVPAASTFALFAAASLALLVIPGPAVLFIVTRSLEQGPRVGLAGVAGVHSGTIVHVLAAAAGLSALLVSSAAAFTTVKYVGAAYLVTLGLRRLFGRGSVAAGAEALPVAASAARAFRQGVVVNVLNPKTALFFLAFLPQFVDPARGAVSLQAAVLGTVFVVIAVVSDSTYAVVAAAFADRIRGSRRAQQIKRYVTGGIFVALGVTAAAARRT